MSTDFEQKILISATEIRNIFENIKMSKVRCPRCDGYCDLFDITNNSISFVCGRCNFETRLSDILSC